MAQRRMFDRDQIFNDRFCSMSKSSQLSYIKLSLCADDDGFVSNTKHAGATEKQLKELADSGHIFIFSSKIILIRDWLRNNQLRKNTYNATLHKAEKALVILGSDKIYYLSSVTEQDQNGTVIVPQIRVDKISEDKISEDKISEDKMSEDKISEDKEREDKISEDKEAGNAGVTASACGASHEKNIDFESFWNDYPKKVNRPAAMAAFTRADAPFDVIMAGLENHKKSHQWCSDDGIFIPDPANWLNRREWEVPKAPCKSVAPTGASGKLGPEELNAIRKALAEGA